MDWLKKRLQEGSTWAGLAAITLGTGQLGQINEAPGVAETIAQAAPSFLVGNWAGGLLTLGMGIAAIFLRDKGGK